MISAPDRIKAIVLIDEAVASGARRPIACAELGINDRTYRRWTADGCVGVDARPAADRPEPTNKLTDAERQHILDVCRAREYVSLAPGQIVPKLADQGQYIGSESTIYRTLHAANELTHRGRAKAARARRKPTSYRAYAPNQLWSWDVSYLLSPIRGQFYYLYLIVDIFSRKIVGWEVHDCELGEFAASLVHKAVLAQGCIDAPLVLHADNGSIQKGSTLRVKLDELGITTSFSRPRVSNDNPYSESLFRTCKYCPSFPTQGFDSLDSARHWMHKFVEWYNNEHCHSGIKHVTPAQRHRGEDTEVLLKRDAVYRAAKQRNPNRWSGATRNWQPITDVWLNPENKQSTIKRETHAV